MLAGAGDPGPRASVVSALESLATIDLSVLVPEEEGLGARRSSEAATVGTEANGGGTGTPGQPAGLVLFDRGL